MVKLQQVEDSWPVVVVDMPAVLSAYLPFATLLYIVNHPPALHRLYALSTRKAFRSTRAFPERLKNAKLSFRKQ